MKFAIFSLMLFLFYSCGSPSAEALRSFRKVDSALERTNHLITDQDSVTFFYKAIWARRNKDASAGGKAADATTLYNAVQYIGTFIRSTQDLLKENDPSGENTKTAEKLLVQTILALYDQKCSKAVLFTFQDIYQSL